MDKEIIENISKVPFFKEKIELIEKSLKQEKYKESYMAIVAMIETVCIIAIKQIYDREVIDSNIVVLATFFGQENEENIKEILIEINRQYNDINLNEVSEIDILDLLGKLDILVKIIIEKHGNVFLR